MFNKFIFMTNKIISLNTLKCYVLPFKIYCANNYFKVLQLLTAASKKSCVFKNEIGRKIQIYKISN